MKWVAGLFVLILILIVIVANLGLGPFLFPFVYYIPWGDKLGHFILMGILSFLVNLAMGASKVRIYSKYILKGSLLVLVVVTLEEFTQLFLKFRGFSMIDLISDYAGIVAFGKLAEVVVRRRRQSTSIDGLDVGADQEIG